MNKICNKCKESKSLDQFYKRKNGKYGVRSNCKECSIKISMEYYTNNRNRIRKQRKEYHKEYHSNNRDKRRKYMKEYRNNNRDRLIKYQKEYYKTEWGKLLHKLSSQNRRYKEKYNTNPGDILTKEQIEYLAEIYQQCAYCNTELTSENTHIDHIHPLSKGGSHSIDNVTLACKDCNLQKNAKTLEQWLKETGYNISIKHLVFIRLQET
jgi:5-methylcytosine-specific restriction endonuclease McrA